MKTYLKFMIISILCIILVGGTYAAFTNRQRLTNNYYAAVDLYEKGNYEEAASIFHSLYGWSVPTINISPEEYYHMCFEAIYDKDLYTIVCPKCNTVITIDTKEINA